jgi:LCP family protein required for cell wall assembly
MSDQPPHDSDVPAADRGEPEDSSANPTSEGAAVRTQDHPAQAADQGFFSTARLDQPTAPKPVKRRNFFRRHLALTSLGVILLLFIGAAGGFVWYLNHELGNIPRINITLPKVTGPNGEVIPDSGKPLNILILGADNGNSSNTVAQELADGHWSPGSHRSDTMMLVHIPRDRKTVQVVSIPRDSWVPVPTFPGDIGGDAKINAAFSWGGPALAVRTVQNLTGLHIDHVAIIDWNGFKDLTDALGGVRVYIPETFYDDSQHITWTKGWHTLHGDEALAYVRTRHGLANGDFGRIERQQNFLRTVMSDMLSSSTFTNPITLVHVVGSFAHFIEVDQSWSNGDIRGLALAMRHLHASDVQFATAPLGSYDYVAGQSIVRLDTTKFHALINAFNHGNLTPYFKANPGTALPGNTRVK